MSMSQSPLGGREGASQSPRGSTWRGEGSPHSGEEGNRLMTPNSSEMGNINRLNGRYSSVIYLVSMKRIPKPQPQERKSLLACLKLDFPASPLEPIPEAGWRNKLIDDDIFPVKKSPQQSLEAMRAKQIERVRAAHPFLWVLVKRNKAVSFKEDGEAEMEKMYESDEHKQLFMIKHELLSESAQRGVETFIRYNTLRLEDIDLLESRYLPMGVEIKLLLPSTVINEINDTLKRIFAMKLLNGERRYLVREVIFKVDAKHKEEYYQIDAIAKRNLEEAGLSTSRMIYNMKMQNVLSFKKILSEETAAVENRFTTRPKFLFLDSTDNSSQNALLFDKKTFFAEALSIRGKKNYDSALRQFCSFLDTENKKYFEQLQNQAEARESFDQGKHIRKYEEEKKVIDDFQKRLCDFLKEDLDSLSPGKKLELYKYILLSYTQESQLYRTTNSVCRSSQLREEFIRIGMYCKLLVQAISHFYLSLHRHAKPKSLWSGGFCSEQERIKLVPGKYLSNTNFLSTSEQQKIAEGFMRRDEDIFRRGDGVLLELIPSKGLQSDFNNSRYRGFVKINEVVKDNMHTDNEREVLFSLFNVFKVIQVKRFAQLNGQFTKITLEYGAHFELLQRRAAKNQLSEEERFVLQSIDMMQDQSSYGQLLYEKGELLQVVNLCQARIDESVPLELEDHVLFVDILMAKGDLQKANDYLVELEEAEQPKVQLQFTKEIKIAYLHENLSNFVDKEENLLSAQKIQQDSEKSLGRLSGSDKLTFYRQKSMVQSLLSGSSLLRGNEKESLERILHVLNAENTEIPSFIILTYREELQSLYASLEPHQKTLNVAEYFKLRPAFNAFLLDTDKEASKETDGSKLFVVNQVEVAKQGEDLKLNICSFLIEAWLAVKQAQLKEELRDFVQGLRSMCEAVMQHFKFKLSTLDSVYEHIYRESEDKSSLRKHLTENKWLYISLESVFEEVDNTDKSQFRQFYSTYLYHYNRVIEEGKASKNQNEARQLLKSIVSLLPPSHPEVAKALEREEQPLMDKLANTLLSKTGVETCSTIEKRQSFVEISKIKDTKISIFQTNSSWLKEVCTLAEKLQLELDSVSFMGDLVSCIDNCRDVDQKAVARLNQHTQLKLHMSAAKISYLRARRMLLERDYLGAIKEVEQSERQLRSKLDKEIDSKRKRKEKEIFLNNKIVISLRLLQAQIFLQYTDKKLYTLSLKGIEEQIAFFKESQRRTVSLTHLYEHRGLLNKRFADIVSGGKSARLKKVTADFQEAITIRSQLVGTETILNAALHSKNYFIFKQLSLQEEASKSSEEAERMFKMYNTDESPQIALLKSMLFVRLSKEKNEVDRAEEQMQNLARALTERLKKKERKSQLSLNELQALQEIGESMMFMGDLPEEGEKHSRNVLIELARREKQIRSAFQGQYPSNYDYESDGRLTLLVRVLRSLERYHRKQGNFARAAKYNQILDNYRLKFGKNRPAPTPPQKRKSLGNSITELFSFK